MTAPTRDAVAIHAYHAWEAEGRPHGRHEHHWFAAETALTRDAAPAVAEVAPVQEAAPAEAPAARKATAPKKPAAPKAAAPKGAPSKAAPKAPAETVVAAAALKAPRAARTAAKGSRSAH